MRLRKTNLDELPQLFNILKGDMSLVGPRPERPFFVEKFREEIPRYMVKHQVRPGLTAAGARLGRAHGEGRVSLRCDHASGLPEAGRVPEAAGLRGKGAEKAVF